MPCKWDLYMLSSIVVGRRAHELYVASVINYKLCVESKCELSKKCLD